ncbi:MAG: hypothetical protein LBU62_01255 [Bacteroidales bacterium]|nr:hypothetical protein [Bacteroidales bacterium]
MDKQRVVIALAVCVFVAMSCKDDKPENVEPVLSISPPQQREVSFTADGTPNGNAVFTVTTNQSMWNAAPNQGQTWCTVTKTATSFTVQAAENTATTERTLATVTVTAGSAAPVVIIVTQAAAIEGTPSEEKTSILSVSPEQSEVQFKAGGTANGNATFTVSTTQSVWNAVSSQPWVTIIKTSTGFTVQAAVNTTNTELTPATVTVTAGTAIPIVMNVTQGVIPADGVLINGVIWAKYNVASSHTFTSKPEIAGGYYNWDNAPGACPDEWRLPTLDEIKSLLTAYSDGTSENGVDGRRFGSGGNVIFLPMAGGRYSNGMPGYTGSRGYYWSSTAHDNGSVYCLNFGSEFAIWGNYGTRTDRFSVRCVAE